MEDKWEINRFLCKPAYDDSYFRIKKWIFDFVVTLILVKSVNFQKEEPNDSAYVAPHISATAILMFLIERL